jgi:hypothetical protein
MDPAEQIDHRDRGGGNYKDADGDGVISHNEAVGDDKNPVRLLACLPACILVPACC